MKLRVAALLVFLAGYLLGNFTRVIASWLLYRHRDRDEMRELMREVRRTVDR